MFNERVLGLVHSICGLSITFPSQLDEIKDINKGYVPKLENCISSTVCVSVVLHLYYTILLCGELPYLTPPPDSRTPTFSLLLS